MREKIAIILGSKTDQRELIEAFAVLKELKINYRLEIISAHRSPEKLRAFCRTIEKKGIEVVIACAGKAAALPGFIASYVNVPVVGVALRSGLLDGLDALLSIVGSPCGLGLVSSGVGRSAFINAVIFSLEIISLKDRKYYSLLEKVKNKFK